MTTPVTTLHGIGKQVAEQLARLGIHSLEDMLFHLPLRYEDRTKIKPLNQLKVGESVLVEGTIQSAEVKFGKRRSLICMLSDGADTVMLRFFHFYPSQREKLKPGTHLRCFGEVRQGYQNLELVHPQYECLDYFDSNPLLEDHLTPIYPSNSHLTQTVFYSLIDQIFQKQEIIDYLPETVREQFNLLPIKEALQILHQPPPEVSIKACLLYTSPSPRDS